MSWRTVSIFLLIQQTFWLVVLLPGHQRGAMVVAGSESCCATETGSASACGMPVDEQKPSHGEEKSDRTSRCAVCFVAVRMVAATAVDLTPPPLELLEVLPPEVPSERPSLEFSPTYLACGPPTA